MRLLYIALLFPLFLVSQDFDYSVFSIPDSLIKNANAVVRLDKMEVTISKFDFMEVSSKRIVTVLNEQGERYAQAYSYYDNHQKIVHLKATVFDANGIEINKFREKDFLDHSASGSSTLYSDSRVKYLNYTPTVYPYTILFERSYETSDTAFVPNWYFLDGYGLSSMESSYSLKVLCDVPVRVKEMNLERFGVVGKINGNGKEYHFTAKNIPVLQEEPFSPPFSEMAPNVKFAIDRFHLKGVDGEARTWEDYGKWIHDQLLIGQGELDEDIKLKVSELVSDADSPKEKIERIYTYLQDNTRYVSVQLGIGGWKPISANEVDRVKYGDCKGLTNYTMALLKEVGIDSYYTVLYAGDSKRDLDIGFPSLSGNHAFLNIPLGNEEIWLECTSQNVPVDFLGTFSDDRYVLKVKPNGGELVKSKKYSAKDSKKLTEATVNIDEKGGVTATVNISSTGIRYDEKYHLPLLKESELEKHYKNYWEYLNSVAIVNVNFENNKGKVAIHEKVTMTLENYLSNAGEKWLFTPNVFNRSLDVPKRIRNRKSPMIIKRGYVDVDSSTINLPSNMAFEKLLPELNLKTEFGEYQVKMEKIAPNKISYTKKLVIYPGTFSKEKYKEFRDFKKKIARHDNAKIVLIKNQP